MKYRREIDGLRALAVLPVIFFHADFQAFSGGFVGVDVFFVISGYLITTIILAELGEGKFSLVNFYERRARRILPALFLVMLVCIPIAWFLLLPKDMKDFSESLIAVSIFASNILFWRESGYFDTAAELKPLVHTWSLAVEEQYYVLFPLFLMLFWRFGKRWVLVTLGLVFITSLAVAQWAAYANPAAAFYLLPTRGWELLLGAFAAFYLSKANRKDFPKELSELGGFFGIVLIIYAVFTFSKTTPFPGFYALIPTLGAVLIILFATQQTIVGKLVGSKVFVSLGLISYSTYLWHQPLFAFARHAGLSRSDAFVFFVLALFSIFLAHLSRRYVETPFRNGALVSKRTIFTLSAIGSVLFIGIGLYGQKNNNEVVRLPLDQKTFLAYFENELPNLNYYKKEGFWEKYRIDCDFFNYQIYRSGSWTRVPIDGISKSCFTPSSDQVKVVFIWGDSHAQQLYFGLSKVLPKDYEVLQVASSGCLASMEARQSKVDFCEQSNWFAYDTIKKLKPKVVIIGQDLGHNLSNMRRFSESLKKIGVERVIFTGPSPHWAPILPAVLASMLPQVPSRTFLGVDNEVLYLDRVLKHDSTSALSVEYISLIDYFCNEDGCLTYYTPNITDSITSWDYGHLSPIASYHFAKDILSPTITR